MRVAPGNVCGERRRAAGAMLRGLVLFVIVFGGMLAGLGLEGAGAFELSLKGFSVPDVSQADYLGYIRWDYTKRVAGAESLVRLYRTTAGAEFRSVSTNGRIWLYYIERGGTPENSFHLADQNGDGIFDTKFLRGEDVAVPYWVLSMSSSDGVQAGQ